MTLTDEQRKRIEVQKEIALKRKRERHTKKDNSNPVTPVPPLNTSTGSLLQLKPSAAAAAAATSPLNSYGVDIWDEYDDMEMSNLLAKVEQTAPLPATTTTTDTINIFNGPPSPLCRYCGFVLTKQSRYYVCTNRNSSCKYRQKDRSPNFVDFQLSKVSPEPSSDGEGSEVMFSVKLVKGIIPNSLFVRFVKT
jgi:hypothetical protein